ncbi:MAG: BMP family ABC transporter substrate-binding protein [Clostridia bacterium]|nr:BMP family ABC transporter substrate-binding protein [Clostridia bacterium]
MKKRLGLILGILMVMVFAVVGCGADKSTPTPKKPVDDKPQVKAGFVYIGPVGDGGWTEAHDNGRKYLEDKLGIETVYNENVPESSDCEKVINDMIDQGCNVIFATSFGFMDYVEKAANNHPDVKFLHCSGYKTSDNMGVYFGRMYEPRYLSGIVAGMKTKTNKIGYVAAFEIPEVLRGINAFTMGVRSVNPEATVNVKWTHTWIDAARAKEAAKALLDENCDILAQHQDAPGPQVAAEEKGVWSVGYNMDMTAIAPKAHMTSPVWNWGPYYVEQVQAIMDGTWESESYWGGIKEGIVDLSVLTENAPEGAKEAVENAKAKILSGENKIWTGPIKDNTGELKVEDGVTLTDEQLTSLDFNWLVEGVIGKVES